MTLYVSDLLGMPYIVQEYNDLSDDCCNFPEATKVRFKLNEEGVVTNYWILLGNFTENEPTLQTFTEDEEIEINMAIANMINTIVNMSFPTLKHMVDTGMTVRADINIKRDVLRI